MTDTSGTEALLIEGTIFGAFAYNLNQKLKWTFGDPTNEDIQLYSDLAWGEQHKLYDILGTPESGFTQNDTTYADKVLVHKAPAALSFAHTVQSMHVTPSDYISRYSNDDGLFGLSYFPWSPVGLMHPDGLYRVKQVYDGRHSHVKVNPLRSEVLKMKLMTTLKITGISLVIFYTGKFAYKYISKKI